MDQSERERILDHMREHAQTREHVVAYGYALAGCPDDLDTWLQTPAAQDAISALLAYLDH